MYFCLYFLNIIVVFLDGSIYAIELYGFEISEISISWTEAWDHIMRDIS
jgi:hypothetical protein